jgi:hypothetical protein
MKMSTTNSTSINETMITVGVRFRLGVEKRMKGDG